MKATVEINCIAATKVKMTPNIITKTI